MFFNKKYSDTKQRFGIRKLGIGVCSVLLSTLFLGVGIEQQAPHVQAATESEVTNVVKEDENKETTGSDGTDPEKNGVNTDNKKVETNPQADKNAIQKPASPATSNPQTKDGQQENTTQTPTERRDIGSQDQTVPVDTDPSNTASLEKGANANNQAVNRSLATKQQTNQQNTSTSAQAKVEPAKRAVPATEGTNEGGKVSVDSEDNRYTLTADQTEWGNVPNGDKRFNISLSGNAAKGDKITVSVPTIVGIQAPTIDTEYGNASVTTVGNYNVVTYTFTKDSMINPAITVLPGNAYTGQSSPMSITYPTIKPITWTVNGKKQKSIEFNVGVNPNWSPSDLKRIKPDPNSSDSAHALKKIIPGYDVTYQISVNENTGIQPGEDNGSIAYTASHVNSAVNYGTIITIPMPNGFVLNHDATITLNTFGDNTTVEQDGNNIIITVPKGSGKQNWNDGGQGYRLVGHYNIQMPETATTYTADAPITIVQKLDESGTHKKTYTGKKVSDEFYGAHDAIPEGEVPLYGKTAYDNGWILNNGKKQIVSYFGLTNNSIGSFENYDGTVNLSFDKRLSVIEIKTPTISGNSNYKYTITYADGSKENGFVNNGDSIKGTAVITGIAISFNNLKQYESTDLNLPGNSFTDQTQAHTNAFEAYGSVDHSVAEGTKLTSNISFNGNITVGKATRPITINPRTLTQEVRDVNNLTSKMRVFGWTYSTAKSRQNAGYMSVYKPLAELQTPFVSEPIFYYVLPDGTTVDNFTGDASTMPDFRSNGSVQPKLILFTIPASGSTPARQVVKIDYSGTGYNYNAAANANNLIHYNTLADTTNGWHYGYIYVISPTTKLDNTKYNPADTSNFADNGNTFNPAWVQNNTSNLYYIGSISALVNQVGGANTASVAQGNKDGVFVDHGTTDIYGSPVMKYAVVLTNDTTKDLNHVETLINLPQASDSSFTFELTQAPTYDGNADGYTFLYSTKLGELVSSPVVGEKPDETGYVTADQVTDWRQIKSIIIKTNALASQRQSSHLILTGTDPNLVNDVGKTGYLSSGFYTDSTRPFINNKTTNSDPNEVVSGSITIVGTAKINYSIHYQDENGQDHTVVVPRLTDSYDLSKYNTMVNYDDALNAKNDASVKVLIPENYEITSVKLIPGEKSWQTDDNPIEKPEFGNQVKYFYNGATIQLEATPIQRTLTYQVIDENDPVAPQTIVSTTNLITGDQGRHVPASANTVYENVKTGLEKDGYIIGANSSQLPTIFGSDNTALTIYVTHAIVKVSDPSQWSSKTTDADKVPLAETITRTINIGGLPGGSSSTTQNVEFNRTAIVDKVTGKIVGYVDPSDDTKTVVNGKDAWKSTNDVWNAFTPSGVSDGYYISSVKANGGDYLDVVKNANGVITGLKKVTVTPDMNSVVINIVYAQGQSRNDVPEPNPQPEPKPEPDVPTPDPGNTPETPVVPKGETSDNTPNVPGESKKSENNQKETTKPKATKVNITKPKSQVVNVPNAKPNKIEKNTSPKSLQPASEQLHESKSAAKPMAQTSPNKNTTSQVKSNESEEGTLPQTGAKEENVGFFAGLLAMILGLFGFGDRRKKKN